MRVLLSGGGTGGHIYPAVTIARALAAREHAEILFVGTKQGLENDIIPKEGFAFRTIDVRGLERRLSLAALVTVGKAAVSVWQSLALIRSFRPDVVIGTGGYVCGPVLLAASLCRVPTVIQEQNVIPGLTNRLLARFVDGVVVGYAEAAHYFSHPGKVVVTGNPIRSDVMTTSREEGMRRLGLDPAKTTILVSGGSRGARSINEAMVAVHQHFAGRPGIQILHITGQSEYNSLVDKLQLLRIDLSGVGNSIIQPYLYDMPAALAAADLAVFRAGAVGLAELTARGIPAVLVPYPYAAENHQEYNARVLEKSGAAVVITDAKLSGPELARMIETLIEDKAALSRMAGASLALGRPQAADAIADLAISLIRRRSG